MMTTTKQTQAKLPGPQERLTLVLLALQRKHPVRELCLQAGVSREIFYRWIRRVRTAGLLALEPGLPGKKPRGRHPSFAHQIRLEARLKKMHQRLAMIRRQAERSQMVAKVATRIIRRRGWEQPPDADVKKNLMRRRRRAMNASGNGQRSGKPELRREVSPQPSASPARHSGDGGSNP